MRSLLAQSSASDSDDGDQMPARQAKEKQIKLPQPSHSRPLLLCTRNPGLRAQAPLRPRSNHLADVSSELLRGEEDFALGQPDLTESVFQKAGLV
jgi:hypothetical protein